MSASPERETSLSCDYDDMLDEEIVEAARAGEREAEEYLITKYKLSLIHILVLYVVTRMSSSLFRFACMKRSRQTILFCSLSFLR